MTQAIESSQSGLTKYPSASFRELFYLSLPLILSLFSSSFMGFCDRLFLAHYSLQSLEGSVSAGYLCMLFQHPLLRIVTMTQVFVGLFYGSKQLEKIGPAIWQMIWLSLFSIFLTLPVSHFVAPFFFNGTSVQGEATTYFNVLMLANFLFPLGATLSSYFVGRGKMQIIFWSTLMTQFLNIGLDYLLIFGVSGLLAPLGIYGAAVATVVSQALLCLILFLAFLRKGEREHFGTGHFKFDWDNFWEQFQVGLPRAIARVILLTAWVCISRIMTIKGGDYLMVLSVGGSLIFLFTFINDGMIQGAITVASNLLGSKSYQKIWKLVRSAFILLFGATTLLAIPYLIFPEFTLSLLFPDPPSAASMTILKRSCIWLWLFFFCYGFQGIALSLVTAARDVTFYMFAILFVWLTAFIPVYATMNIFNWSPDRLWLLMAADSFFFGVVYFLRSFKERWRDNELDLTASS